MAPSYDLDALHRLLARQHGLITRAQARALGLSDSAIDRRLRTREWVRLASGVFLRAGTAVTWNTKALAACLAGNALASHRTAAVLWGLSPFRPGPVEITTPRHLRSRTPGVRAHESSDLDLARPVVRSGIPVTGIHRTLLDLGAVVPLEQVQLAIDDARRQKLVHWPGLYETLVLHSRRGRNGCGPFRAILDVRYGELRVPDSDFERMVQTLLADAGLPEPEMQVEVFAAAGDFIARVDLAYQRWRIAIELDGRGHITDEAFEHDPIRRNRLELEGWLVLDFTWRYYVERSHDLVADVWRAVDLRRGRESN